MGYTERFYFGNPGQYQTYLLAYNDAAGDSPNIQDGLHEFATGNLRIPEEDICLSEDVPKDGSGSNLCRSFRVNTLTVLDLHEGEDEQVLMSYLGTGVDHDSVRQIPE